MGSDVKNPAKVDGAVEAYLMLLWFVFVRLFVDVRQRREDAKVVLIIFEL